MKHVGVLAHSAEGSALCYLTVCHEGARRLGEHQHPEVTLSIVPMGVSMDAWARLDLPFVRNILAGTAARLAAAGCDFFVCPDNTAHIALEAAGPDLALPGLHIAEVVADQATARGFRTVGVLGTAWTMDGPIYRQAFARRGLDYRIPPPDDRAMIHRVIFEELCNGMFDAGSRAEYLRVIDALKTEGCEAVVLGCTEIPLLVTPADSSLPTLDSTRLLAAAAVEAALGDRPMPVWRGGPLGGRAAL